MSSPRTTPEDHTFAHDDLLAPGTLCRPDHIPEAMWERMPWPARWRATRAAVRDHRQPADPLALLEKEHALLAAARPNRVADELASDVVPSSKPCGTHAAYNRHLRYGETPCLPCRFAERIYRRDNRASKAKSARAHGVYPQTVVVPFGNRATTGEREAS